MTAFDAVPRVFGEAMTPMNANWWLSETLCYLRHLQVTGRAEGDGASPSAGGSPRSAAQRERAAPRRRESLEPARVVALRAASGSRLTAQVAAGSHAGAERPPSATGVGRTPLGDAARDAGTRADDCPPCRHAAGAAASAARPRLVPDCGGRAPGRRGRLSSWSPSAPSRLRRGGLRRRRGLLRRRRLRPGLRRPRPSSPAPRSPRTARAPRGGLADHDRPLVHDLAHDHLAHDLRGVRGGLGGRQAPACAGAAGRAAAGR